MFQLRLLQDFKFVEDSGSDQGINGEENPVSLTCLGVCV